MVLQVKALETRVHYVTFLSAIILATFQMDAQRKGGMEQSYIQLMVEVKYRHEILSAWHWDWESLPLQ